MTTTDEAEARRILHEDQISATVQAALKALDRKRWILFHAKDYLLGVLQLLEQAHLLRNRDEEQRAEKAGRESLTALRLREKAYHRLARIAAEILPDTFGAEVARITTVRTEEELDSGALTTLTVAGWAHAGSGPDAIALAKVRKLARDSYKRKTISRADLLAALGETGGQ